MEGDTASFEQAAEKRATKAREQSTIGFPYHDIEAGIELSDALYSRAGLGSCELDELAAEMGQVLSGSFRVKLAAAKTFGFVDKDGRSAVRLTSLGERIVENSNDKAARLEAFFNVPLYEAVYDAYKGKTLPPMKALEREMEKLGVSSKQTDKARQAFDRSARQAGLFEAGDDRLVKPRVEEKTVPKAEAKKDEQPSGEQRRERTGGGGGGGLPPSGKDHPLIQGLLLTLPEPGEEWPSNKRDDWLEMARSIFSNLYKEPEPSMVTVEVDDIDDLIGPESE